MCIPYVGYHTLRPRAHTWLVELGGAASVMSAICREALPRKAAPPILGSMAMSLPQRNLIAERVLGLSRGR